MVRSQSALWIILSVYAVLALLYTWATPPLEASDEREHVGMIQGISVYGDLPVQNPLNIAETWWEQEGSQPPLYYLMSAVLIAPIVRDDWETARLANPHATTGIPLALNNKNRVLPSETGGTATAVYVLRLFGIVLGAITVSAVFHTAKRIVGDESLIPVIATGITAFNPMFLFITASVNNDNLVIALNSLLIYQLVVMIQDGFSLRRSFLIAVLIALATLSKLSGLVLIPVFALSALWVGWHRRDVRGLFMLGGLMVLAWGVIAGWWYLRNIQLYSELFGTGTMVAVAGARPDTFTLATLLNEFEGFRIAYWGLFGAVNILTVPLFYGVMDIVVVLALIGLGITFGKKRHNQTQQVVFIALSLTLLIGMIAVIQWTSQTYASQGRLLFPYLAATSPLLAIGLVQCLTQHWMRIVVMGGVGMLALFALAVPLISIRPAYAVPIPLATLPLDVLPVYARFSDIELVGYRINEQRFVPDDTVPIELFWRVVQSSDRDYSLYLHAVDAAGNVLGRVDSFPGGGSLQTSQWQAGAIYADSYQIRLDESDNGQSSLRIQVGWWHYASGQGIRPQDGEGNALESVMLNVGAFVGTGTSPEVEISQQAQFGDAIMLQGYTLQGNQLTLSWRSIGTLSDDYTVFVQVLDDANQVVGQGDAPPSVATRFWLPNDEFVTEHTINYSVKPLAGDYRLVIGWYRASDFLRLTTNEANDAYLLTTISLP